MTGLSSRTGSGSDDNAISKSPMQQSIARLEMRIQKQSTTRSGSSMPLLSAVPPLFAPFVAPPPVQRDGASAGASSAADAEKESGATVSFQSIQQRRRSRGRRRPSRKGSNRPGKAHCQKRTLSQQLREIIDGLNPTEITSGGAASGHYDKMISDAKAQLKSFQITVTRRKSSSAAANTTTGGGSQNPETARGIASIGTNSSTSTASSRRSIQNGTNGSDSDLRDGDDDGDHVLVATVTPICATRINEAEERDDEDDLPDGEDGSDLAAAKIQALARRCKARRQFKIRRRIQAIQQQLDGMPSRIQRDREELRHSFEGKKHELQARVEMSLADMRRKPSDHSAIMAYLHINNAHLRIMKRDLAEGLATLQKQHEGLMKEHETIQACFKELEEVAVGLLKENRALVAAEKKFRNETRRKYKDQLYEQERHLRGEQRQNATYKKCLGRIIRHVARHEAIAKCKPRRGSEQPIIFDLADLVASKTTSGSNLGTSHAKEDSDRSIGSSSVSYSSASESDSSYSNAQ